MNIPYSNHAQSQYFGKYGPIESQMEHSYLPLDTVVLPGSPITVPTVVMSIPEKIVGNSDLLVIEISTNLNHDTSASYLLQIQHKETIVYQQVLSLERRMAKEKISIDASLFDLPRGGVLSVNLQRIRPDFQEFLDAIEARTSCDLQAISSAYTSMSTENQALINAVSEVVIGNDDMEDVVEDLTITIPGTSCLLIGPDLVSRFVELSGTILIFKKPTDVVYTNITMNCAVGDICSAG